MKTVILTRGWVAWVDDADYEPLQGFNWQVLLKKNRAYATRSPLGPRGYRKKILMHRVILGVVEGQDVDHVEHRKDKVVDNRRMNLRLCSRSQNLGNRRKSSGTSSRFKGVYYNRERKLWQAYICLFGRQTFLGRFSSEEEAARAYDAAAKEQHGKFARLNFPTKRK